MSVVVGDDIVSPDLHKAATGVECSLKIGRKIWPGRVVPIIQAQPQTKTPLAPAVACTIMSLTLRHLAISSQSVSFYMFTCTRRTCCKHLLHCCGA